MLPSPLFSIDSVVYAWALLGNRNADGEGMAMVLLNSRFDFSLKFLAPQEEDPLLPAIVLPRR